MPELFVEWYSKVWGNLVQCIPPLIFFSLAIQHSVIWNTVLHYILFYNNTICKRQLSPKVWIHISVWCLLAVIHFTDIIFRKRAIRPIIVHFCWINISRDLMLRWVPGPMELQTPQETLPVISGVNSNDPTSGRDVSLLNWGTGC